MCVGCGVIQPPPPAPDLFLILGLTKRYFLEASEIDAAYRSVARLVHPDRFTRRPAVERRMALQWTASVNEARRTLTDPVRRAWWLATGSAQPREKGMKLDPRFLERMFEWREREEDEPGSMRAQAIVMENQIRTDLDALFRAWEAGTGDLKHVEEHLSRLNYVTGLGDLDGEHRH